MCLIIFAWQAHPRYRLVLAANRDEFRDRPAARADFWPETPGLLAGRDLKGGGTWLGVTREGRLAAVTNYRDPRSYREGAPSRGHLVTEFLRGDLSPATFLDGLRHGGEGYNGFNLLAGDREELWYYSNRGGAPAEVAPGIHGLSNHLLDTPWPKVERGREALARLLAGGREPATEELFALLADRAQAPDQFLPDTGVGIERERLLSPLFIDAPGYGTRSSTLLLVGHDGAVTFIERSFDSPGIPREDAAFSFVLPQKRPAFGGPV